MKQNLSYSERNDECMYACMYVYTCACMPVCMCTPVHAYAHVGGGGVHVHVRIPVHPCHLVQNVLHVTLQ